jgi:hypothetical protein
MAEGIMKIKKMELITLVIATLLANILIVNTAQADECWRLERQLNKSENMLRRGGDASYMKLWRQSRDHNHEELQKCKKRFGKGAPQITVYSGTGNSDPQHYREHIHSNINNPQLQSLIKTCNYWIDEVNRNSSPENLAFRANACRDARTAESRILNPPKTFVMVHKRSAKECIKPNQVIDNEVKECMEGLREPTWKNE